MSKQTILLHGKKHSIPRCFENLLYDLEALVGIKNAGTGSFIARNHRRKNDIEIKYYDGSSQKMKITAYRKSFSQDFYLKVTPSEREYVESRLREYRI